eukprot:1151461-Pelagomonas_calceolata.AAC.4
MASLSSVPPPAPSARWEAKLLCKLQQPITNTKMSVYEVLYTDILKYGVFCFCHHLDVDQFQLYHYKSDN